MLATLVGLALAMASPGLAADGLVPNVEIPAPPDLTTSAPSTASIDSTQPPVSESSASESAATEPPITVSVNDDGGDIAVSVRVLSPGEDTGDAVESAVISGSDGPDIRTDAVPTSELPGDPAGNGSQGSNTNVTVRVLSPGDNGPVGQLNPLEVGDPGKETAETVAEPETPAAAPGEGAPDAARDSVMLPKEAEQYQDSDSRYQSVGQFEEEAWIWNWYLSLDCDGNATSSSIESGRQSSRDWTWKWTWEWGCGSPPHPPPVDSLVPAIDGDAMRGAPEPSELEPTSTAPADEAASGDDAALEQAWLWTWTFTFCGETVTAALPFDTNADLAWVWEWMWTWTCRAETVPAPSEGAFDPSPAPATGTPSGPGANSPAAARPGTDVAQVEPWLPWVTPVALPAWVISLLPFPEFGLDATIRLVSVLDPLTRAGLISTLLEVAPIPLPLAGPAAPVDSGDAPAAFGMGMISPRRPQLRDGAWIPAATISVATDSSLSAPTPAHSVEPRAENASPARRNAANRRSRGTPLSPWPPPRPFQAAGAPGASSSFAPSISALGIAALVALFVLAAPGFGRRIRIARALRPRGTYGSSIDRPG